MSDSRSAKIKIKRRSRKGRRSKVPLLVLTSILCYDPVVVRFLPSVIVSWFETDEAPGTLS